MIDVGFARFQVLGFTGSQLSGANAIRDSVLLIFGASSHFAHRGIGGPPMILRSEVRSIGGGRVFMGHLLGCGLHVVFSLVRAFPLRRYCSYSTGTAVEANVAHLATADDGLVHIGVVDHRSVHVDDCRVIREVFAVPCSANKSHSAITESVVHAAVEANLWSPIAGMKLIHSGSPA